MAREIGEHGNAVCEDCGREMYGGAGCTWTHFRLSNGRVVRRFKVDTEDYPCHDCGAAFGTYHHDGCDTERCPVCGGQALGCDCLEGSELLRVRGSK
jgi:hypothetical protein